MGCSTWVFTWARVLRLACVAVMAIVPLTAGAASAQTGPTMKVAFYNIKSGIGSVGLPGRPAPFADTYNCTDSTAPLNAWGVGLVQRELQATLGNDPAVVALGLAEAWRCGSPENVRQALNWKARSEQKNGLGVVARYGFAGPVTFLQLDTTLSTSTEPRYVLHAPVCVDAGCSASFDVFMVHTSADGSRKVESATRRLQQVVAFMAQQAGSRPRALLGDFNLWERKATCAGAVSPTSILDVLRHAGYVDAWPATHGTEPGYTGMTNRQGCGSPEGSPFKRVDYAWSLDATPRSMARFAVTTPGEAALSDHVGIVAEYPSDRMADVDTTAPEASIATPADGATVSGIVPVRATVTDASAIAQVDVIIDGALLAADTAAPFEAALDTTRLAVGNHTLQVRATDAAGNTGLALPRTIRVAAPVAVPPPAATPAAGGEVVLHAASATTAGLWQVVADPTAAGGSRLFNPDRGAAKVAAAAAAPASYADFTFAAEKGKAYRLWMRGQAANNSYSNDSAFVQFSDAVDATGVPMWRIGTTAATTVQIEEGSGAGLSGWGWADNMWGGLGPLVYFETTGLHTLRLQIREDGLSVDQVVLSAATYLTTAPGRTKDDTLLLRPSAGAAAAPTREVVLYAAEAAAFGVWQVVADPTAAGGALMATANAGAPKLTNAQASPMSYVELTFEAEGGTPYRLWLRGRAERNSYENDSAFIQFSDAVDGTGAALWPIGTTAATMVSLEECSGCGVAGWGWQDNGYGGVGTLGPLVQFASTGLHTIRIQVREDGFALDQIVLSPERYLTVAPGANKNDQILLPR